MKLLIILFSFLMFPDFSQKEFVCLPCGRECDNKIYSKGGNCKVCGMELIDKSTIRFKNITVDELCNRISSNKEAVILDVRSSREYKGSSTDVRTFGHFKNAININVTELESKAKELDKYKGKEILVYCSHAHRSATASYFLSTHGFQNVNNMLGGVSTIDSKDNDCLKRSYIIHDH